MDGGGAKSRQASKSPAQSPIGEYYFLKLTTHRPHLRPQGGLDVLHHLFGSTPTPMLWARNTGMAALNAVPPLKSVVTKYAMGL